MARTSSYLRRIPPLPREDRLVVNSERCLNGLEEIKEVLRKIEGNTQSDVNGKSVRRDNPSEKVSLTRTFRQENV